MSPLRRALLGTAVLPWLCTAGFAQSAPASPPMQTKLPDPAFTGAQRAEIVAIVRDALKTDPSILRDAVIALRADEEQQRSSSTRSALSSEQDMLTHNPADQIEGNSNGDVTLVVFYDPRCPYCRRLNPTIAALLAADPKLRLVYKDMPILGPASLLESRALLAAQRQNGYLPLMRALMQAPPDATPDTIKAQAQKLGLDWTKLEADMDAPGVGERLDANIALARRLGIEGTPAMVIGDQLIPGAVDLADLQAAVAKARQG